MLDDLRGAFRRLRNNPGASAGAVLALGIGIGFNTSIYSVADALLLRLLPVPEIDRVVLMAGQNEGDPRSFRSISPADYREWKSSAKSFQSLAVSHGWSANLTGSGDPVPLAGAVWVARLLRQFLFGVSALDILAFVGMPLALALALTTACLVPARRATRTDPLTALRHE